MACNALMDDEFELSTGFFKEARAEDYGVTYNRYADRIGHGALREEAREAIYNGDYYVEKGETAIICFNKFVVDNDAWRAFYAGEGERPLVVEDPETGGETYDSVGVMLAGLERAAKNPKIKNIIEITGQFNTKEEIFDFNQDGKIDDSDVSPYTDYHYGVLTSDGSFSCGNAFPFFMHEHGAMILGEKSSGGACGVRLSSVGGIEVQNSAASIRDRVSKIVMEHKEILQMHGFFVDEKEKIMRFDIIVSFDSLSMKEMFNHVVQDVRDAFPDYDVQVQFDVDISD